MKTTVSEKGQIVIPKEVRERLGLIKGAVLNVKVEGKKVVLEPVQEPPKEIFVRAGPKLTEPVLAEAKATDDKIDRLLKDLGV